MVKSELRGESINDGVNQIPIRKHPVIKGYIKAEMDAEELEVYRFVVGGIQAK